MQRLRELACAVDKVFEELEQTYSGFQRSTGLTCRRGCGSCCNNPQIEATMLELLPLALNLFDQGRAEQVLTEMEQYNGFACFHYKRHSLDGSQGECSVYKFRPAICRMFGAAGVSEKFGAVRMSVCRIIKQEHPDAYQLALIATDQSPAPKLTAGKERVRQLDYNLGKDDMPINQALIAALKKVLFKANYNGSNQTDRVA